MLPVKLKKLIVFQVQALESESPRVRFPLCLLEKFLYHSICALECELGSN